MNIAARRAKLADTSKMLADTSDKNSGKYGARAPRVGRSYRGYRCSGTNPNRITKTDDKVLNYSRALALRVIETMKHDKSK
jgi:hypothetical protein